MTNRNAGRWSLAVILLMLLLSGCGGDNNGSAPPPSWGGIVTTPIATSGCGKTAPVAQGKSADFTITSDGLQRTYRLHIPVRYDPYKKIPLVLSMHGYTGHAANQEKDFGQSSQADTEQFLVVYPQATNRTDNGEPEWATEGKYTPTVNDVLFFSNLLTTLQQQLCVDAQRIYAIGFSNGGGMANLLACKLAGRVAAVALVAAAIYELPGGCHPVRPVPYLTFHGTGDSTVSYTGGSYLEFVPVMQTMQEWATRNGCTSGPSTFFQQADVTGLKWSSCRGGVVVEHYRIDGGGHQWPSVKLSPETTDLGPTTTTISATELSWQFFKDYHLP
jgi:polyhydroxybutyrate depolymerase